MTTAPRLFVGYWTARGSVYCTSLAYAFTISNILENGVPRQRSHEKKNSFFFAMLSDAGGLYGENPPGSDSTAASDRSSHDDRRSSTFGWLVNGQARDSVYVNPPTLQKKVCMYTWYTGIERSHPRNAEGRIMQKKKQGSSRVMCRPASRVRNLTPFGR